MTRIAGRMASAACERDALSLAAGQAHAALAD